MSQSQSQKQSSRSFVNDGKLCTSSLTITNTTCSSDSSCNSHEQTAIHNPKADNDVCSTNNVMKNSDEEKSSSSSFNLIIDFLKNIQLKSLIYEQDLKSIENLDFNFGDLLKQTTKLDYEDDDVHVSKMIAKARESMKNLSILSTLEYQNFIKQSKYYEEFIEKWTEFIDDSIHNLKQNDFLNDKY